MKNDDVQLIQRVLEGDDTAFSTLVGKYQKSVHALAWRKIGDFHIAEDITQETFLKAYQKLSTLKQPQSFVSWLYVITANRCNTWLRKRRLRTQPLETASGAELEKATYSGYVSAENERTTAEAQREVVKKLLAKLKESDRTVITLYYFGGMTYEEISKFLGVSVGAIKNRVYRAQERLKKEEPMIREALENFQITPNLTENIMQEVSRLKPVAPSGNKPLAPWGTIGVSTIVVIFLMLGLGMEYLSRFQKPYSFDATSEMTIDIIETPVVLDIESEPDVRTQLGSPAVPSKNDGAGQRPDEVLFAAAQADGEDISVSKQQWIQTDAPSVSGIVSPFFVTSEGTVYAFDGDLYQLVENRSAWQRISEAVAPPNGAMPMVEHDGFLYIAADDKILASANGGRTWYTHAPHPTGVTVGFFVIDNIFYLAFEDRFFRSEDTGKTWDAVEDGFARGIRTFNEAQDMLFAGTHNGLYRMRDGTWKHLKFPVLEAEMIRSVAVTDEKIYVVAELSREKMSGDDFRQMSRGEKRSWWIFRSTDLGDSWKDITPTNAWHLKGFPPIIKLIAVGETLLAMEKGMARSINSGDTWMTPQPPETSPVLVDIAAAVALDENTFYVSNNDGIHRSIDGGASWHRFNAVNQGRVDNLIVLGDALYGRSGNKVVKTTNRGRSWKTIQTDIPMTAPHRDEPPIITQIVKSGGVLCAKGKAPGEEIRLYQISQDSRILRQIQEAPVFHSRTLMNQLSQGGRFSLDLQDKSFIEQLQEGTSGATQFFKQLAESDRRRSSELIRGGLHGAFAFSGNTFYIEYNYKLFRWELGEIEWYDTELEETAELSGYRMMQGFKLAASANTVYVGKRDGHLVVSFDKGNNWIDLTPALPFPVKAFYDIVFVGSTIYVATDAGVAASSDGKQWRAITDTTGTSPIIGQLAVEGTTVYGISKTGAYRLENDVWKQIASEVPERVTSFAVERKVLYVGTQGSGMLHFNLNE